MNRTEKQELIQSLNENLGGMETVVVAHYKGLNVDDITDLRKKMRAEGGVMKVAKNTLVRLALKDTQYESLTEHFVGQTAIFYSTNPVAPAKVVSEFANDNENLVILGGAMGANLLDVEGIQALAKLPSLDELRAKLVGLLQAPAQKLASVTQAPAGQLARVFGAYAAK